MLILHSVISDNHNFCQNHTRKLWGEMERTCQPVQFTHHIVQALHRAIKYSQAGIILFCFLVTGCRQQVQVPDVQFRVPVSVAEVSLSNVEDDIVTTGSLRASEVVTLTVTTGGLLQIGQGQQGRLAEGDDVKADTVVARIIGEDIRLAIKKEVVKQRLETAEKNLYASSQLIENGLISIADYGQRKIELENAKLEYENSEHTDSRSKIVTPIDGVIFKLARDENSQPMANGQYVGEGQEIAEIGSLDALVADVDLLGKDIAKVKVGMRARVRYYAWDDLSFDATVIRLAPVVDHKTRTLRAEVLIDNVERLLRPGMFVKVTLVADERENVPVVPRQALTERAGQRVVFVLNGQRVEKRQVVLGLGNDKVVEIRQGVKMGEKVVVLGLETLKDHMPVSVAGI